MKNRIIQKLRSRAGASITYALLLFLVCAVLCSVILTAATAASGRMSQMAQTDQRYYAVTSAAELLKDVFQEQPVTITRVTTGVKTDVYTDGSLSSSEKTYDSNNCTVNLNSVSVVYTGSNPVGFPVFSSLAEDAAFRYFQGGGNGSFQLQASEGLLQELGLEEDPLALNVTEIVAADGTVTLTVGDSSYQLRLVFSASTVGPATTETPGASTVSVSSETAYTVTTVMTRTESTKISWKLTSIQIVSGT